VGNARTLLQLNLNDCSNLVEFPSDVSGLKVLQNLNLSNCPKLKDLPQEIGSMYSLKQLLVDKTAISVLPESIFRLTKLEKLSLNGCQNTWET
jgi:Leucine-rich repeat (LRR) protein